MRDLLPFGVAGTVAEILILGQAVSENYFMLLGAGVISTLCGSVAYLYKQGVEDRNMLRKELDECQEDRKKLWEDQAKIWERVSRVEAAIKTGGI